MLQLIEFASIARSVAQNYQTPLSSLEPIAANAVARFYWMVVALMSLGILFITWWRMSDARL